MRRLVAACVGALSITACSGKDHSLGMGMAPAERSPGGAAATDAASNGTGGAIADPSPEPTSAAGGARSSGASSGMSGAAAPATGGATSSGGAVGTGGSTDTDRHVGVGRPFAADPVIPPVSGDCPAWANGMITFMGLGGIQIAVGPKPQGPTGPMLVYWHGTGSTSGEYAFMAAPVVAGIQQAGGVIVSFQGTTGGDLYSGTSIFGVGDLNLVDQLVACAVRDYNVDPRKIFTMGCSAGGLFAGAMAALRSNYVAAVETNSGGWVTSVAFESSYTPPLMTVHGAQGSDVVIVDFSQTSMTADFAFKARGGFIIDCDTGGGHCGGAGLADDAWQFFVAHPYAVVPEPWARGLPAGFSSQCN
jgi:hypothetical protein